MDAKFNELKSDVIKYAKKYNVQNTITIFTYGFLENGAGYTSYLLYFNGSFKYKIFPINGGVKDEYEREVYTIIHALKAVKDITYPIQILTSNTDIVKLNKRSIYRKIRDKWKDSDYEKAELLLLKEFNRFYSEDFFHIKLLPDEDKKSHEIFLSNIISEMHIRNNKLDAETNNNEVNIQC